MCFSNGYALNISRLVNLKDCKLYEIKSHDCHVFMQKKSFHLCTVIYCKKKKYEMHSQKSITFLEIYALVSCIPNTYKNFK